MPTVQPLQPAHRNHPSHIQSPRWNFLRRLEGGWDYWPKTSQDSDDDNNNNNNNNNDNDNDNDNDNNNNNNHNDNDNDNNNNNNHNNNLLKNWKVLAP